MSRPGGANLRIGAILVATLVGAGLLSFFWTPYPPAAISVSDRLLSPSFEHWLGADGLGRDVGSQILAGARVSIAVGLTAVLIGLLFGVMLGLAAAMRGGLLDQIVMRTSDLAFAFPALLTAIILTAAYGPGVRNTILAIGLYNTPVFAILTRATGRVVLSREFILAARMAGKSRTRIAIEHVLPNIAPALIVQATIQFAIAILAEAALSYLGIGAQPPQVSWGRMLSDAQPQMFQAPRLSLFPGVAIALSVLGLNLLGDGLRDLFDPRLRASR